MTDKEGSPALGHYPHLTDTSGEPIKNHAIGKVIVETAEKAGASFDDFKCNGIVTGRVTLGHSNVSEVAGVEYELPEHLWSAADENGNVSKTATYYPPADDGMSEEVRKRWHDEAQGTIEDDAEFIKFADVKDVHNGYIWHESGMSPNPIDTPNLVHHSDVMMYAKLFNRLQSLGYFQKNEEGYCLAFTFRLQRFLSHGKVYSRYVTNEDGELKFFTIIEEGVL